MSNLEDLIDPEYGLQQDEWSLTRPKFGKEGQLEVVGWSGKNSSSNKQYILICQACSQDKELFGEGYFRSLKSNLNRSLCCGCGKGVQWTEQQYAVLCKRALLKTATSFVRFDGDWKGAVDTKVIRLCEIHGEMISDSVSNIIRKVTGCAKCQKDAIRPKLLKSITKRDSVMIESFISSGGFAAETKFQRISRSTKDGRNKYWLVVCPECGESGESTSSCLQRGSRPCSCTKNRQKEAYLNFINCTYNILIKFGVANSHLRRIKDQQRSCIYPIESYGAWRFPTKSLCFAAERECKQTLECGVLTKEEMPDGYTETTWVYNLEKIISIYEKHGGVRVED